MLPLGGGLSPSRFLGRESPLSLSPAAIAVCRDVARGGIGYIFFLGLWMSFPADALFLGYPLLVCGFP
jgi:hypothetical protein